MGFWNNDHELSAEFSRIWEQYIPMKGATEYTETELLRAANRIIYDWYNNGWGVNNKTAELEFLQEHGLFERISPDDMASMNGDAFEEYMDTELASIVEVILEAEEADSLTPLDGDPLEELGLSSAEWDSITRGYEEEEDDEDYFDMDQDLYEDDEDYDD